MSRITLAIVMVGCVLLLAGCGSGEAGQPIDVSNFDDFTFSREIDINKCFIAGDILSVEMTSQVDNRVLNYSTLTAAGEGEVQCLVITDDGGCLVAGETVTRVLVKSENTSVDKLFSQIMIANQPSDICGAGNVTTCSEDLFAWDGLTVSADFCEPVHVLNGYEVMGLLRDLRDGPPSETDDGGNPFDAAFQTTPIDILGVEQIMASDQFLGKNGDYVVIRTQSDLDGVLLQDGSVAIDFQSDMGIAVVIIRAPCQEFTGITGVETLLTVDISGTMGRDDNCGFDLGSIDAFIITIRKSPRKVRLFLNDSELDEIHL